LFFFYLHSTPPPFPPPKVEKEKEKEKKKNLPDREHNKRRKKKMGEKGTDREGTLWKKSANRQQKPGLFWHERYFILKEGSLFYYTNQKVR
jgi:hypothetical protein